VSTAAAVALLALGGTACGGSDEPEPAPEPTVVTDTSQTLPSQPGDSGQTSASTSAAAQEAESITATMVDFAIELDEDSFSAGAHEITVVNDGGSTHDLVVERDGQVVAASDPVDPGRTTTFTVALEPGEYVVYCSVANHRAMGMETTIEIS
jgi:plastocyanin